MRQPPVLSRLLRGALLAFALALVASPAEAMPAFARKYGTSCTTCHTVFPRLSPFGEAFRRNGYRFPGIDGDYIKQEHIPLGNDEQKKVFPRAIWPGLLPASAPLAVAVNGSANFHPDKNSGAALADNGAAISINDLVGEAHLFAGGSFTERLTYFAQLTFHSDGTVEIEDAHIHFNDLLRRKHEINVWVGKGGPGTLTSFGLHSSYLSDVMMAPLAVTALYGASSESWSLVNNYTGAEVNGVIGGRFDYSIGVNAGSNNSIRVPENAYAHVGFKLGGMRLDGEGGGGPPTTDRPWEETSFALDAFAYRSKSRFTNASMASQDDVALTFGANVRLQLRSFELNSGIYQERHDHATVDNRAVNALSQYNELSYIVFPWLVPALRLDLSRLEPAGLPAATDFRITPGVAFLIVANLKLVLAAQIEWAQGVAPVGGWGEAGGFAAPPNPTKGVLEVETVTLTTWFAF